MHKQTTVVSRCIRAAHSHRISPSPFLRFYSSVASKPKEEVPLVFHSPHACVHPYRILFQASWRPINSPAQNMVKYHPLLFKPASSDNALLTREYIYDSLYNKEYGYFSTKEEIINPDCNIDFPQLKNKDHYLKKLRVLYDTGPSSAWLTPVEIFKPWYGHALANYIRTKHSKLPPGTPLKIFEMGGGLGTCAESILSYIQTNFPDLYKITSYTIIEISTTLAAKQKQKLARHMQPGKTHVQIKRASIFDWTERVDDECVVIGMEVLDNFPHDKIVRFGGDGGWHEAIVRKSDKGTYYEDFRPVADPLIIDYLAFTNPTTLQKLTNTFFSVVSRAFQPKKPELRFPQQITYIPTMAFWFLQMLHTCFPRHHLILSDFSFLPSKSEGSNAPVVQRKKGEATNEYYHYLVPQKGTCDIFFPTDFSSLQHFYHTLASNLQPRQQPSSITTTKQTRTASILHNREFMKLYANVDKTTTASGYNPLLEDYSNVHFLISD